MNGSDQNVFSREYMPYIIRWGRLLCWLSIPLIFIPAVVLAVFWGAAPPVSGIVSGLISACSSMLAWYIVDPVTLYPILHVPGLYLTYIAGNAKEIRAPATAAALASSGVEAGTEQGTVIATIAISVSCFASIAVMTLVALAGGLILSVLPKVVLEALGYLLPGLFGAMCMTRIMRDPKTSAIVVPAVFLFRQMSMQGWFRGFPLGGGYVQILLSVIVGVGAARFVHRAVLRQANEKTNES